jgi:flagellar operon protein
MAVDLKGLTPNVPGVGAPVGAGTQRTVPTGVAKGPSFADMLNQAGGLGKTTPKAGAEAEPLKFSNHAVDRMVSRGIRFSPEDVANLQKAVERADAKGSKNSLILMNDSALIVSVKNKTVVTVMDKTALKENVFTNIDSTIVM